MPKADNRQHYLDLTILLNKAHLGVGMESYSRVPRCTNQRTLVTAPTATLVLELCIPPQDYREAEEAKNDERMRRLQQPGQQERLRLFHEMQKNYDAGIIIFSISRLERFIRELREQDSKPVAERKISVPSLLGADTVVQCEKGLDSITFSSIQTMLKTYADDPDDLFLRARYLPPFMPDDERPPLFSRVRDDDVRTIFQQLKDAWTNGPYYKNILRPALEKAFKDLRFRKIVCFGLGNLEVSVQNDTLGRDSSWATMIQHIFALELKQFLIPNGKLYLDDPIYTKLTEQTLLHHDPEICFFHKISLRGLAEVDSHTLVLDINCDVPIKQILADFALERPDKVPGAMIWLKMNKVLELKLNHGDHDSPRTYDLSKNYDEFEFPLQADGKTPFGTWPLESSKDAYKLAIYTRNKAKAGHLDSSGSKNRSLDKASALRYQKQPHNH
ncbi:hypothetical protein HD806DRAFT_550503 [Xylariaceae sp. AK1471]|nr:hypothetical protein HD806DRAFT_550503 [Xylariaceae sp. AK1471]